MTGKELTKKGRKILHAAGWVTGDMTDKRRTPPGMIGWPDIAAHKNGMTAWIEVKGEGDKLRPSQIKWRDKFLPHTGPYLMYVVAECEEDFERLASYFVGG